MDQLWNDYGNWLLERVGFYELDRHDLGGRHQRDYTYLMEKLHNMPFTWIIDRDEDRMRDGLALRYDFFDENGVIGGSFVRGCSVLEMLVALAIKIDDNYIGDPSNPHPEHIFWELIFNLELDRYPNMIFDGRKIEEIVEKWLKRQFESDGKGSIFPLKSKIGDTFDARNEEIWRQATAYLSENY